MTDKTSPNKYGRRWGRGLRPYLIAVKLIAVAAFLGGLMSVLAVSVTAPPLYDAAAWTTRVEQIERIFCWVVIPGSTTACIAGLALFASVWRALLRMRWMMAKVVLVVVGLPLLHLVLRSRLMHLEAALDADAARLGVVRMISRELTGGVIAGIGLGLIIALLGRVKPRLGQDYGKTFAGPHEN